MKHCWTARYECLICRWLINCSRLQLKLICKALGRANHARHVKDGQCLSHIYQYVSSILASRTKSRYRTMNEMNQQPTYAAFGGNGASSIYPSRILEVRYQGKLSSSIDVSDENRNTPLYTIKTRTFKPQLTFTSISDNQTIATVEHHNFSNKIDITVRGQPTTLKQEWKLKESYTYTSPTTSGAHAWKADKLTSMDMICLDERGMALARWQFAKMSMTKLGTLEIVGDAAAGGPMLEEIIVTGVTVAHYQLKKVGINAAAAGSAASSAAAV